MTKFQENCINKCKEFFSKIVGGIDFSKDGINEEFYVGRFSYDGRNYIIHVYRDEVGFGEANKSGPISERWGNRTDEDVISEFMATLNKKFQKTDASR